MVDFSFITHVLTGMYASVFKRKGYRFQKIPSPLHIIFRSLSPRVKVLQFYLSDSKRTRELLINDQAGNPSTARSTVDLARNSSQFDRNNVNAADQFGEKQTNKTNPPKK